MFQVASCLSEINISEGSVVTHLRCGGYFIITLQ